MKDPLEETMDCSDLKDDLLGVLYGEADAATLRKVKDHEARCAACRDELSVLRRLRHDLAEWRLPEPRETRPTTSLWARLGLPPAVAAAAVLLVAVGGALGLSGAELRFEKGPLRLRIGGDTTDVQRTLAERDRHLQQEIAGVRAAFAHATPSSGSPLDEEAVLQRVQDMIRESEARQAALMKAGLLDLSDRAEAQRRYDLARVSAGLSYLDGKTGQQVARTTELMGYVLQASQKR
jgi:hypothetical protein